MSKPSAAKILIVGPLPLPLNGVSIMTQNILKCGLQYGVKHVDTSDHREVGHLGVFDLRNVVLAVWHVARFTVGVIQPGVSLVYIPISQNWRGYLRDALFLCAARCARRRIVVHLHGGMLASFYSHSGLLMRFVIRRTLGWADAAIALGESLRSCFDGLVSPERVYVVPNGVDDNGGPRRVATSRPFRVVHVSNLMESKGALDVLRAAAIVVAQHPDIAFVLAGPWATEHDEARAREIVDRESLHNRVQFVGPVSGPVKDELLGEGDLFVMPTYFPYEGQPLVILEALSHGLPVIATDWGAIAETVVDGVSGQLVPPKDPRALAEAIVELIANSDQRLAMAAAARKRFEDTYTIAHLRANLSHVFQRVLDGDQHYGLCRDGHSRGRHVR